MADLIANVYTASTTPGVDTRHRFLTKALKRWGQVPLPPTIEKIEHVVAALRKGGTALESTTCPKSRLEAERNG